MNTPAHLIFASAAFAQPNQTRTFWLAALGGLLPDISLYGMVAWHLLVLGTPENVLFGEVYYSDFWQQIFAIDNAFLLWGLLLFVAAWRKLPGLAAFAGGGLLHLVFDFPLHHDDGRAHFWPLTDWVFQSPVSYWDPAHYGIIVSIVEIAICLVLSLWLWRRFSSIGIRIAISVLLIAELIPGLLFYWWLASN